MAGELPGVDWQRRCAAHFERSALAHVPASATGEAGEDLKAASKARREKSARTLLAEEFVELYGERHPKAISIFEAGIGSASTYLLNCPGAHHARMRTTNALERLFKEVKRRTKVVGAFPNETSALATEMALRSSEEWALITLPRQGSPRSRGKTEPTTFETLIV